MKKLLALLILLCIAFVSFAQQVRDHRNSSHPVTNSQSRDQRNDGPPPAINSQSAGLPVTNIELNKWYYIKHAGTKKYMMISGHKDPSRSMACLTVEEMQQDNTSQQWRFVAANENGGSVYKLQNRKYRGDLNGTMIVLYLDFKKKDNNAEERCSFMLVQNPDKSWYILRIASDNSRALSTNVRSDNHCFPYESDPLIGGRVLNDFECAKSVRAEFVTGSSLFTGQSDQKWILEEVKER